MNDLDYMKSGKWQVDLLGLEIGLVLVKLADDILIESCITDFMEVNFK